MGGRHLTVADIIAATDFVLPVLEIIDSRVRDWNIGIFDTLADSGSGAAVGTRITGRFEGWGEVSFDYTAAG